MKLTKLIKLEGSEAVRLQPICFFFAAATAFTLCCYNGEEAANRLQLWTTLGRVLLPRMKERNAHTYTRCHAWLDKRAPGTLGGLCEVCRRELWAFSWFFGGRRDVRAHVRARRFLCFLNQDTRTIY